MRTLFGELPDEPPAQRYSPTSVAAAQAVAPRVKSWQQITEDAIRAAGPAGLTDEEGIDRTGMPPSTYRPRRIKLVELGRVRDSGDTRPTRSGHPAIVWVIVTNSPEVER